MTGLLAFIMSGIKRTPLDAVFSDLIRERADWTCQCCGREYPDRKGSGLHCSHYFGRRGASTRHHGDNCFALCFGCHQKMGANPHDHKTFAFEQLGEPRYDELVRRAYGVRKRVKGERKDMQAHFKAQLEYIRRRRMEGETGLIEFAEWD